MTIREILNILLEDKIVEDVEVLFSTLFTKEGIKCDNDDKVISTINRLLPMSYDGIILTDKNKHLISKYNKDIIKGEVNISSIRLDDIFISLIMGDIDLDTKYKNKCSAVLNTDIIKYSSGDEHHMVLNAIIHIDGKLKQKSMILCHELTHLVIKYNKLFNNMDFIFDNELDEEFICDVIACKVNNPYNWRELFEELLININENYKEFYKVEYAIITE